MGNKAKWEYLRAVYERYHKAEREMKHLMLNEFWLNTGYHRVRDSSSEWTSSRKTTGTAAAIQLYVRLERGVEGSCFILRLHRPFRPVAKHC